MIPLGVLASAGGATAPVQHPLIDEYLEAEEYTHDWADLTGWSVNGVQVSSNRLYGISGGNPVAAGRPFSVAAGEVVKVTAEIVNIDGNAGTQYVGVNFGGANDGVNASLPNFVGIGIGSSVRRPARWVGGNFSGVTTGNVFLGDGLPSGTYRATVVVDEQNISLVLQSQDGTREWSETISRSAAPGTGAITSIIVWNGATNGTAGNYVKAIGARKSLTPFRVKSNAAGVIEGNTDFVMHRNNGSDTWRIQLPAIMDGMHPCKMVAFFHQATTGNRNSPITESRWVKLRQALMDNGYALVSADDAGDRWGNPSSVGNYASLVNWLRAKVYTGNLYLLGYSMGGLPMLNAISTGQLTPVAVTAICPVTDLIKMRDNPSFTASIDAAWGSNNEATLIANSAGYNPMTRAKPDFGGIAYQFNVAADDPVVPAAQHTYLFEPLIAPYAVSSEVNLLGTGHGPVACFDPLVILPHFNAHT